MKMFLILNHCLFPNNQMCDIVNINTFVHNKAALDLEMQ